MAEMDELPMCGVCHNEKPINGIRLECGHIFCYLCIKSASEMNCTCPICRAFIKDEFNFQEHHLLGTIRLPASIDGHYWFYEGFRGWWLFDADTNKALDDLCARNGQELEIFIAGGKYIIDLRTMTQRRLDDPDARVRKICKASLDLENILGMAGIKGQDIRDALDMMRYSQLITTHDGLANTS